MMPSLEVARILATRASARDFSVSAPRAILLATMSQSSGPATMVSANAPTDASARTDSGSHVLNTILMTASTPNTTTKIAMNWRQSAPVGRPTVLEERMQAVRDGGSLRAGKN